MVAMKHVMDVKNKLFTQFKGVPQKGIKRDRKFWIIISLIFVLISSGICEFFLFMKLTMNEELITKARQSQRLWDTLVPERSWSIRSPGFIILALTTGALYCFNRYYEEKIGCDDMTSLEEKNRLEAEIKRSLRSKII